MFQTPFTYSNQSCSRKSIKFYFQHLNRHFFRVTLTKRSIFYHTKKYINTKLNARLSIIEFPTDLKNRLRQSAKSYLPARAHAQLCRYNYVTPTKRPIRATSAHTHTHTREIQMSSNSKPHEKNVFMAFVRARAR